MERRTRGVTSEVTIVRHGGELKHYSESPEGRDSPILTAQARQSIVGQIKGSIGGDVTVVGGKEGLFFRYNEI